MEKNKKVITTKDKKQAIKKGYSKNITYSTSKNERVDLLDIVEMYLCKTGGRRKLLNDCLPKYNLRRIYNG